MLGVGGAGRAIAFGAVQAGAQVTLVDMFTFFSSMTTCRWLCVYWWTSLLHCCSSFICTICMLRLQVILANRSRGKADDLAAAMGGSTSVASLEEVAAGSWQLQAADSHGYLMLWCTCFKGRSRRSQRGTRAYSAYGQESATLEMRVYICNIPCDGCRLGVSGCAGKYHSSRHAPSGRPVARSCQRAGAVQRRV